MNSLPRKMPESRKVPAAMHVVDNLHAFLWEDPAVNNCNSFFIDGNKKILVDPGHEHLFDHVRRHLSNLSLTSDDVDLVLVTHAHPDHMQSIRHFKRSRTLIALPEAEVAFIAREAPHYRELLGMTDVQPQILLKEGSLRVGDIHLEVLHTSGHSPGSVCFYWRDTKALFTGDVIFAQGVGRTDLPGGSGEQLKGSLRKLSVLEPDFLLPGHGSIISGRETVRRNFEDMETLWFAVP